MSKQDKRLEQWRQKPRPVARVDEVEAVLRRYFGDRFRENQGGSHQFSVSHPALYQHPNYLGGTLSIPIKNGQTVKPFYLKHIAEAIQILQEAEKENDHENNDEDSDQD